MTRQSCRGPAHASEIGKRSTSMRCDGWTHVGTVPLLRRLIVLIVAATLVTVARGSVASSCDAGSYDVLGSGCTQCPGNSTTSGPGATSIWECLCPEDTWLDGEDCQDCPENSTSSQGSAMISNCTCDEGLYLEGEACVTCGDLPPSGCPAGTIGSGCHPLLGVQCVNCPVGLSSFPNATACVCGLGRETTNCTACPMHQYKDEIGYDSCTDCPAFSQTAGNGSTQITDCYCNAGYYGEDGEDCAACEVGTFKMTAGDQECMECPRGMWTWGEAALHCTCNKGWTAPSSGLVVGDDESCVKCSEGKFKDVFGEGECEACPPGSTSPPGSIALEDCRCEPSVGFWLNVSGGGKCVECMPYIWLRESVRQAMTQPTTTSTPMGANASNASEGWQMPEYPGGCEAGQYWQPCETIVAAGCVNCPAKSWSLPGRNGSAACKCLAGYTGPDGGPCQRCPMGTYKSEVGSAACTACSAGATSDEGSEAIEACRCLAGRIGPNGGPCLACPAATYKGSEGSEECTACFEHSETLPGSTALSDCKCSRGYYHNGTRNECIRCPSNMASALGSVNISACLCGAGFFFNDTTEWCTGCPVGTFKAEEGTVGPEFCLNCSNVDLLSVSLTNGSAECLCRSGTFEAPNGRCALCPHGHAKATVGDEACTPCARGTHQPLSGQRQCMKCPANTYNRKIASKASQCLACRRCPEHTRSPVASEFRSNCTCVPGYTGPDGLQCEACAAGTYKNFNGSAACLSCTGGSDKNLWSHPASVGCMCNAGYMLANEAAGASVPPDERGGVLCQACEAGKFKSGVGDHGCLQCEVGKYAAAGAAECSTCPPGSSAEAGSTSISDCGCLPGYAGDPTDVGGCVACTPGFNKSYGGPGNCLACPIGTYQTDNASTSCIDCLENSITAGLGATNESECLCDLGFYQESNETNDDRWCSPCEEGHYKSELGPNECLLCNPVNVSVPGQCLEGQWWRECAPEHNSACVACKPNSWGPALSSSEINCVCNAGYSGPDGGDCEACSEGTFKDVTGSSECVECGEGRLTHPGATHVSDCFCPHGYVEVSREPNAAPICACDVGYTVDEAECVACEAGTFKSTQGSSACEECASGFFTDRPEASSCALCTPIQRCRTGQYWRQCPGNADGHCVQCSMHELPENAQFSGPGFPFETDTCPWSCDEGYVETEGVCVACPAGQFRSTATGECTECSFPTTSLAAGATACTACETGFYFVAYASEGHAVCNRCEGRHTTTLGPSGRSEFSNVCRCDVGYFGFSWGCQRCPAGGYKNYVTPFSDVEYFEKGLDPLDDCLKCPEGSFGADPGQVEPGICTSCPDNSVSSADRSECLCIPGFYDANPEAPSGLESGVECVKCPFNTYNPSTGADSLDACIACPDTKHYSPVASVNQTGCVCNAGYFGDHFGCEQCPIATYNPFRGQSACSNCSAGAVSLPAATSVSGCFCQEEYYGDGINCTQCPSFSSSPQNSTSINNCTCVSGFSGNPADGACEGCPSNMYTWESSRYCSCNAG